MDLNTEDTPEVDCTTDSLPIVSVVVPFYNVAEYAGDCLDSLVAQDFDRYEVVCIDDGSTDGTEALLDRYADQYSFVRVFHCENGGVSVARNRGVALARAELITFVDGDDFVSPHYVRALYEAHGGVPDRMAKADYLLVPDTRLESRKPKDFFGESDSLPGVRHFEGADAVRRSFLMGDINHYAWCALVERDMYLRIPFEPGVAFEDVLVSTDLMALLTDVVLLDAKLYGYVQRKGSAVNFIKVDEAFLRDDLAAIRHFQNVTESWEDGLKMLVAVKEARLFSALCTRVLQYDKRGEWGLYLGEARRSLWKNRSYLLQAVKEGVFDPRRAYSLVMRAMFPDIWLMIWGKQLRAKRKAS